MENLFLDEDEAETKGKLCVVGGESGSVQLVDLRGRVIINSLKLTSAVNCIKFFSENVVISGCEDGSINVVSVPDMKVINQIHDSTSSIQSLLPIHNGFIGGKYDGERLKRQLQLHKNIHFDFLTLLGTCVWYCLDSNNGQVTTERIILTGADIDPIYSMARDQDFVFTASRDGCIRKYMIADLF